MKLVWLFGMVVLAFVGLGIRITVINASQGIQFSIQVLSQSQQKYDSRVIPVKRFNSLSPFSSSDVLAIVISVNKIIIDGRKAAPSEKSTAPSVFSLIVKD